MSPGRDALAAIAAAVSLALPSAALGAGDPPGSEWTPLNDKPTGGVSIADTNELGLVRSADGVLHALWVNARADGTQVLLHTAIKGTEPSHPGAVRKPQTVMAVSPAAGQSFNDRVDVIGTSTGGLQALFSTTFPGSEIDGILATTTSADAGLTWSAPTAASATASGQRSPVYAATGIAGGVDLQGVPTGAWGDSSPDGGGYRVGLTTNGPDSHFSPNCCELDPGVAVDSVTGQSYIATNLQDVGIHVISTSGGDFGTVPQSAAAWTQQRTSITGRIGAPGVYVGYGTGSNQFNAEPAIYRVGQDKFIDLKNQHDARHVGIAPAPGGRLWIYWDRDGRLYASRTNREATEFGTIVRYPGPPGSTHAIHRLAGEGSLGSLDLFALTEKPNDQRDWWLERLVPGLTLEVVGDETVKAGQKVKLKVTDAGDPVKGVAVYVVIAKHRIAKTTNAGGTVNLKIPEDTNGGKEKAFTDAYPDYADANTDFQVNE